MKDSNLFFSGNFRHQTTWIFGKKNMPNDCIMDTRRRRTGDALGRAKHDGVTGGRKGTIGILLCRINA